MTTRLARVLLSCVGLVLTTAGLHATAPDLQSVADVQLPVGQALGPIPLVVKDNETAAGSLTLSADSSNPTLVPVNRIVFGGQNWGRNLTVTPVSGQTGRAVITLHLSDGTTTTSESFNLDVIPSGNTPPSIAGLPTFYAPIYGHAIASLTVAVTDAESPASVLTLTATSSAQSVLPNSGLTLTGSGPARTLAIAPLKPGAATITLAVSDGVFTRRTTLLFVLVDPASATTGFGRARGIFILDSNNGANTTTSFGRVIQYRDGNIRNYPFVDGFTLRAAWDDMESGTTPGDYDFKIITNALNKLPAGQRLSLIITPDEPTYIAAGAAATWSDTSVKPTRTRAVPWDEFQRAHRRALIAALGQAFASDPRVDILDPYLPGGFTGIRDPTAKKIYSMPGYTRENYLAAIQDELRALQDSFPTRYVQIGFWPVTDLYNSTYDGASLSEWLRPRLLAEFDGNTRPRVGFFMENLAATRPAAGIDPYSSTPINTYASALYAARNLTWNSFQMLGCWVRPFNDNHVDNTLNGTPNDAIEAAYNTYGSQYTEVYNADIDEDSFNTFFQSWHDFLHALPAASPYTAWLQARFGADWQSSIAEPDADPDTDSLPNLLEYASGTLPRDPLSVAPFPAASLSGDQTLFRFIRQPGATDLTYTVEASSDLSDWTPLARSSAGGLTQPLVAGVQVNEQTSGNLRSVQIVDYLAADAAHPRRFLRLAIVQSPAP